MTQRAVLIFLLSTSCMYFTGCTQQLDAEIEKTKVKSVVDEFQKFWELKDMNILSRIMAQDADMISFGSDASEIFIGWNALRDSIQKMLPAMDKIEITSRDQHFHLNATRDIAWFSQIWDWNFEYAGQRVQVPDQRLTGVLQKRDDKWFFVQFHNSVPVRQ